MTKVTRISLMFGIILCGVVIAALSPPRWVTPIMVAMILTVVYFLWQADKPQAKPRLVTLGSFNRPNLQEAICSNIRANLSLHGGGFATIGRKKDALLLKWVIDNEYVPKEDLERAVHNAICQVGWSMFVWCQANPLGNRPDHALAPEALGYAMKHGVISDRNIASIRFDHSETPEEYIRLSEGLFEKVMQQLRDGTAFFEIVGLSGTGESCHDCH